MRAGRGLRARRRPVWVNGILEAADRVGVGVAVSDMATGGLDAVNATGAGLLGRSRRELEGGAMMPRLGRDVLRRLRAAGALSVSGGDVGRPGLVFGLAVVAVGGRECMVAHFHREAAHDLDAPHPAVLLAADAANIGVCVSYDDPDKGPTVMLVNRSCAGLLGETPESMRGRSVYEWLVPGERPRMQEISQDSGPGPISLEATALRRDGRSVPVEVGVAPGTYQGRRVSFSFIRDLTERHRAAEERRIARENVAEVERMREAKEFRRNLINHAAHDLNTPLTPVLLQLKLLDTEKWGRLSRQQRHALDVIQRNVDQLARLVRDLAQAGSLDTDSAPGAANLGPLFVEARRVFAVEAKRKGVHLDIGLASWLRVQGSSDRLRQVLWNLIDNSLKFTPPGGTVSVRARPEGHEAHILVMDTGIGWTAAQQREMFEPFRHPHASQMPGVGGSGLGLYTSRRIVESYGGRLRAESDGPGKGAVFTVVLRRVKAERKRPRQKV